MKWIRSSGFVVAFAATVGVAQAEEGSTKAPPLSPEQSLATMEVQDGYHLVPVLSEPHIDEPVAIAWDGNGRLYVVEMRTYMQDIDGRNQLDPVSRVSRHEDTDGDGIYDKHTVFADNLALPRMVLPLIDRVIIRETNTLDLKSYQDTDGDGVADRIEMWHEGGPRGGNLEHQPSGLIWNIDNWLYTTYSAHRYRFAGGKDVIREPLPHASGQWGLTHDDVGRIFYSTAGGENPAMDFQRPIIYGRLTLPGEQAPGFRECFPIARIPDVQGGPGRVRDDNTLNRFTGCGGQSIYRGDRLPSDLYGDLIIPEPVGRLVRRAKVTNDRGRIVVANAYDQKEFIASRDPNFRPVNSATGPDGCLYIVDMYRGIIQEGNWVRQGSYLRNVVKDYQLDQNIGRGRIYRVEQASTHRGPRPRMLEETPLQLVKHLAHPNGWWRSEAQKLIVLHGDKRVVGLLEKMSCLDPNPLARLHALWTLEGLGEVGTELLAVASGDSDPRVRGAAMRIAEPFLQRDRSLDQSILDLAVDEDPDVVIQTMLSILRGAHPDADAINELIRSRNSENPAVRGIYEQMESRRAAMMAERRRIEELRRRDKLLAEAVVRGKLTYATLCVTCHGSEGTGQPSPDNRALMLAPPLSGSPRVEGHKERLIRILLHGLIGPVDGNTYSAGLMLPMGTNDDQWIADIGTFIRNSWGNKGSLIEAEDVARIRRDTSQQVGPWTLKQLKFFDPPAIEDRGSWKLTASHNAEKATQSVDGNQRSRWDTGKYQTPGMWFGIELAEPVKLMSLVLDTRGSDQDFPRRYTVHVSKDGSDWELVANGGGDDAVTEIEVDSPDQIRHIRITQTGESRSKFWSIHELTIKALSQRDQPPPMLTQSLSESDADALAAEARLDGDALRGARLFYDQTMSCAKCHDPDGGERLGPDLAAKRDGVSDAFLVESSLEPSKQIREEFAQVTVLTIDGLAVTGFKVSQDESKLVIREPAGGKKLEIDSEEIDVVIPSKVSAMPAGLVNQLRSKQQFLDLIRFLMSIHDGGSEQLVSLKKDAGIE